MNPQQALQSLIDGNARFVATRPEHPHQEVAYRRSLVKLQEPFAAILSCSDSRVPSEMIFDQGFGDLFVVRVAGNVIDEVVLASLEFAVVALKVSLIAVIGHTRCGAISAAVKADVPPGHLPQLTERIKPAVERVRDHDGDLLVNATRANAKMSAEEAITRSTILKDAVQAGSLIVAAGVYDLETGEVTFLD